MADEEHVKRLKQGIAEWNAWREDNPMIRLDLVGADLSLTKLIGADLCGADLSRANLRGAYLTGTRNCFSNPPAARLSARDGT
jgi:uncharacterized protein YjbI with pentapeptide repeats